MERRLTTEPVVNVHGDDRFVHLNRAQDQAFGLYDQLIFGADEKAAAVYIPTVFDSRVSSCVRRYKPCVSCIDVQHHWQLRIARSTLWAVHVQVQTIFRDLSDVGQVQRYELCSIGLRACWPFRLSVYG